MPVGTKRTTNLKNNLKICCYNVNGLYNKINFPYFFDFLGEQDVFCCLETHIFDTNKQTQISKYFPNFNLHWTLAGRITNRGRGIAGKLLGWRKDLPKLTGLDCKVDQNEDQNIEELLIKKGAQVVLRILPIYLRHNDWDNEFLNFKNYVISKGTTNLIVLGDCNVRIGELKQEYVDEVHSETKALGTRNSKDKTTNAKGKNFIEFCNDYNLWILNGAFEGDEEGSLTYCSTVGESVNDIAAVSNSSLGRIQCFNVEDANWSDHFPINLVVKIEPKQANSTEMKLLPKLVWKSNWSRKYCTALENQAEMNAEDLDMKQVSQIIKNVYPAPFQVRKQRPKQKWFDKDCENARKDSFKKLQEWRNENRPLEKQEKRNAYVRSNRCYANLLEEKRENYFYTLQLKLDHVRDAKEWWALAKEFMNHAFTIGSAVSVEAFMQYFQKLLNPEGTFLVYHFAEPLIEDPLLDRDFDLTEVVEASKTLKDGKAPGEDRVPYEFYKYAPASFHQVLANIFTRFLNSGEVDESFFKSIIFPIHKKGDFNDPSKYRGITFMNCGPKLLMSALNKRLTTWVEVNNKLNEFQAGFRPKYSTIDNIYNLSSIIQLKFHQGKKVYAFFVDFKAAFDCVPRQALFYKLSKIGVSTKFLRLLSEIYKGTFSAVWYGEDLSAYFETYSGVKQGCLISPLLFALFLDDLHDELEGGLIIDGVKIRILLYADDIVILADNPTVLQRMITNLERYCKEWNMTVNMDKSEIVVFRQGGKLASNEAWKFNNLPVKISNSYTYLGVKFTSKMSFTSHIEERTNKAKTSIYGAWEKLLKDDNASVQVKIAMFKSAIRSIQCYAGQVFGYGYEENINSLQLFFLKNVLRLPSFTPTYAIFLETKEQPTNVYMLQLHMNYIFKTLFTYDQERLPHVLSHKIIEKKIFWFKEWENMAEATMVRWTNVPLNNIRWKNCIKSSIENYKVHHLNQCLEKQAQSTSRFYKHLSYQVDYLHARLNARERMYIIKSRCDILGLNGNLFGNVNKQCSLCNRNLTENVHHLVGECSQYEELRMAMLGKRTLDIRESINLLNGRICEWKVLAEFVKKALEIRGAMI